MIESLFIMALLISVFMGILVIGGLIAKFVFGCDWNEPEYYEYKKRRGRK